MILDLFFPNRCMHCNRIIDAQLLVCNLCFDQIHFTHFSYNSNNPVKEKCRLLFPVENAYALMQFEINMQCTVGTSAGALNGFNYVAGQIGRSARINLGYRHDSRYVGLEAFKNKLPERTTFIACFNVAF